MSAKIIKPERELAGIRFWADYSPTRFPQVIVYEYHGRGSDGLYYFHRRGQNRVLVGKCEFELNSMFFYPFLIVPAKLRAISGEEGEPHVSDI